MATVCILSRIRTAAWSVVTTSVLVPETTPKDIPNLALSTEILENWQGRFYHKRTMTNYFRPGHSVVHERFGDETVAVNLNKGLYYSLRGTANLIWLLAVNGWSQEQILKQVCASYLGDPSDIGIAVATFVDELVTEQLLVPAAASGEADGTTPALGSGAFIKPVLEKYGELEELLKVDPIHQGDELGWPTTRPPGG